MEKITRAFLFIKKYFGKIPVTHLAGWVFAMLAMGIVVGEHCKLCSWQLCSCAVGMALLSALLFLRYKRKLAFDVSVLVFFFLLGMLLIAPHAGKKQFYSYPEHKEGSIAAKVSDGISAAFHRDFSKETAGFLDSVILGRHGIKRDVKHIFRDAGTSHAVPTQCRGKHNLAFTG